MVYTIPANRAILIRSNSARYQVHTQVAGAGAIRIAQSRWELETPVMGISQGIVISSSDGLQSLWWSGELWAIGEGSDAQVNFQFA
jgi:hypothetical protein